MEAKAEDIYQSFNLLAEESKVYNTVRSRFESHFIKRRNTIFEWAKCNWRVQLEDESVDDFIVNVYSLAKHYQYGQLHDKMVCDRIAVGIKVHKTSNGQWIHIREGSINGQTQWKCKTTNYSEKWVINWTANWKDQRIQSQNTKSLQISLWQQQE